MKLVKKSKLNVWNGLVMKGDKIKNIDPKVVSLANQLEEMVQRKSHEIGTKRGCDCAKKSEPFKRMHEGKNYKVEADTPALDAAVERSLAIMDDIDRQSRAKRMNDLLELFKPLLEFADSDKVLVGFDGGKKLDTPVTGSVLELTVEDIYDALAFCLDGITYDDKLVEQDGEAEE